MSTLPRKAVLLINLGSPQLPDTRSIRKFLNELLSDTRVMDMPAVLRWSILHFMILPFRPRRIVNNYRSIWSKEGFPLIRHGNSLVQKLSAKLGSDYHVYLAMRYGSPSIESALDSVKKSGIRNLTLIPLFPQYASATTGSALEKVLHIVGKWPVVPTIKYEHFFYHRRDFIDSWVKNGETFFSAEPDHVLFSFHGLPIKQILQTDSETNPCLKSSSCCETITSQNENCYRAQCVQTAKQIATGIGIPTEKFSISFQSRLGRTQWLEPYTSSIIQELATKGIKKLLVFCPSFIADCLETVFEIGVEEKENFIKAGGEHLTLVPSLNSDKSWVDAVYNMVKGGG